MDILASEERKKGGFRYDLVGHFSIGGVGHFSVDKTNDEDFKKNAVKLSYASPKTVVEISEDLGIHPNLLYRWRQRYTADGDKTKYAP